MGGGISGLSAAWRLDKKGFHDFVLLEMEREAGGNSRSGQNEITSYPWAAHYIPVPSKNTTLVRELMEEFGVLQSGEWNERYLCYSRRNDCSSMAGGRKTSNRSTEQPANDRDQMKRFGDLMRDFERSGQFTVPMESGAEASPLDGISMQDWAQQKGFDSPYLRWYIDYACRDEYGGSMPDISAWAGIYYFAAHAEHDDKGPITQPEGNGWIVKRLTAKLARYLRMNSPVTAIRKNGSKLHVLTPIRSTSAEP